MYIQIQTVRFFFFFVLFCSGLYTGKELDRNDSLPGQISGGWLWDFRVVGRKAGQSGGWCYLVELVEARAEWNWTQTHEQINKLFLSIRGELVSRAEILDQ